MSADLPLLPLVLADVPASLARMLAQDGVPTVHQDQDRARRGRFVLFDSRRTARPPLAEGQTAIDVEALRDGGATDPLADADATASCRTVWRVGRWEAREETAAVDRASLRRDVLARLRRRIEAAGGAWGRVRVVPYPFRSAICFRFDHDEFVPDDFDAVLSAIAGMEGATTHFVCAATHAAHADALARLRGLDVGSHGYRHHTYRTEHENLSNIRRGIDALRQAGLEPSGFAAPHGRYDAGLAAALAASGVSHSSEFSLAYDDLPFFPAVGAPLQIPIHPVCLGIVLEAVERSGSHDAALRDAAADAVADYFIAVAEAKLALGEPIFLYGHPDRRLGRHPQVLRRLFAAVAPRAEIWKTTFTQFQSWWRARAAIETTVRAAGDGWTIDVAAEPSNADGFRGPVAAFELFQGDRSAIVPLDRPRQSVAAAQLRLVAPIIDRVPKPIRREPRRGMKARVRHWLDWELVTPIDEIDARRWPGRLKRFLRKVRC